MNRAERRKAKAMARKTPVKQGEAIFDQLFAQYKALADGLNPRAALQMARVMVEPVWTGPLSEIEQSLSEQFIEVHRPAVWYHGGAASLGIGDTLVPAKETGADPRGFGNVVPDRLEWVYITGNKKMAACFAEQCDGKLFVVEPAGRLIVDPTELRTLRMMARLFDAPLIPEIIAQLETNNFCCERAEIVGIEAKFWGWE